MPARPVLFVLEGELVKLTPGMSYQVADSGLAHRSHTDAGTKLFIVD